MWRNIGRPWTGIWVTLPCSSASQVISEESDLNQAFKIPSDIRRPRNPNKMALKVFSKFFLRLFRNSQPLPLFNLMFNFGLWFITRDNYARSSDSLHSTQFFKLLQRNFKLLQSSFICTKFDGPFTSKRLLRIEFLSCSRFLGSKTRILRRFECMHGLAVNTFSCPRATGDSDKICFRPLDSI